MTEATAVGVVAAASLAPLITVRLINLRYLNQARDVWLLGVGWTAAAVLCTTALPLGLAGCAVLAHWRSWHHVPALLTWVGIVATWLLVQALPPWAVAWLPVGWRLTVGAGLLLGVLLAQHRRKLEPKASTGTRIMLAALLVLVWPHTAWWEWPLYAYAVWLTSSGVAGLALLGAVAVRYPVAAPYAAGLLLLVIGLYGVPWTRVHLLDRTPRGSSLDGMAERWRTWGAIVRLGCRWPVWLLGAGPSPAGRQGPSLDVDLVREEHRLTGLYRRPYTFVNLPAHCDPLEYAYAYGLLGLAAMGALAWQVGPRLALGDAWSASAVAGLVVSLAAMPARVAPVGVVWLVTLAIIAGR